MKGICNWIVYYNVVNKILIIEMENIEIYSVIDVDGIRILW